MPQASGRYDLLCPSGKVSAFVKPQKCLELCPRHFLGFTQALTFSAGYNGTYLLLARDIYIILYALSVSLVGLF